MNQKHTRKNNKECNDRDNNKKKERTQQGRR